jgi:cell division protein FtsQ
MTRKNAPQRKSKGGSVEAPGEFAFAQGDTPKPGRVASTGPTRGGGPGRGARVWGALKLAFGMVVVLTASGGIAWAAHRFAVTTPRFAALHFKVDGNRRSSDDRLLRLAGLEKGQNLFELKLEDAEARLLADPWIEQVSVARHLPGTVRVEVVEREAAALALIGDGLHVVDRGGLPFKEAGTDDPWDLPVLTGLSPEGFALDRSRELERARAALALLKAYEALPMAQIYPPQEVRIGVEGTLTLVVGQKGLTLHLGRSDHRKKLAMAARVVGDLQRKGTVPGIVFLDNEAHPERVVVRMR